jgi:ATPase complex subunit ATP10
VLGLRIKLPHLSRRIKIGSFARRSRTVEVPRSSINIEENWLKATLVKLFMPTQRKRLGFDNWGRYFLVQKGVTEDIRDTIGLLNSKVGYTYLLDGECRIRWAGSGQAEGEEKENLVKCVRRLVEESQTKRTVPAEKKLIESENAES